ncbi:MAG: hypothetical protein Q9170_001052 [Blastenia crenularia]
MAYNYESHEKLIEDARRHYGSAPPKFTNEYRRTRACREKEVILPAVDGQRPTTKDQKLGIVTSQQYNDNYFFWTLNINGQNAIVKAVAPGNNVYVRWLGIGQGREGFAENPVAFAFTNRKAARNHQSNSQGIFDLVDALGDTSSLSSDSDSAPQFMSKSPFQKANTSGGQRSKITHQRPSDSPDHVSGDDNTLGQSCSTQNRTSRPSTARKDNRSTFTRNIPRERPQPRVPARKVGRKTRSAIQAQTPDTGSQSSSSETSVVQGRAKRDGLTSVSIKARPKTAELSIEDEIKALARSEEEQQREMQFFMDSISKVMDMKVSKSFSRG